MVSKEVDEWHERKDTMKARIVAPPINPSRTAVKIVKMGGPEQFLSAPIR